MKSTLNKKAISFIVAAIFVVGILAVGLNGVLGANAMPLSSRPMRLSAIEVDGDNMKPFVDEKDLVFYIILDNPAKGDSITINMDDRIFTSIKPFSLADAQVGFSKDGHTMSVSMTRNLNTSSIVNPGQEYCLTIRVPFVYNKETSRKAEEPQYTLQELTATDLTTQNIVSTFVNIENQITDLSAKENGYLLSTIEKLSYDSTGQPRIATKTFYNYGRHTWYPHTYVGLRMDWRDSGRGSFILDKYVTTVDRVYNSIDSNGKFITNPIQGIDSVLIWNGITHLDGYKNEISGSFNRGTDYWSMVSEKSHPITGNEGGFKGTSLRANEPLLLKYNMVLYPQLLNTNFEGTYYIKHNMIGYFWDQTIGQATGKNKDEREYSDNIYFTLPGNGGKNSGGGVVQGIVLTEEYEDTDGNSILASNTITYLSAGVNPYTMSVVSIPNYQYEGYKVNGGAMQTGICTIPNVAQNTTVTAVYSKTSLEITSKYVDQTGAEIKAQKVEPINRGNNYVGEIEQIVGYVLDSYEIDGVLGSSAVPIIQNVTADHTIVYKYKIGPLESDLYDIWHYNPNPAECGYYLDNNIISNIEPGTTIDQFLSNIKQTAANIVIYDVNNNLVNPVAQGSQLVTAGMKIQQVSNNVVIYEYYTAIFGDANGDGAIDNTDIDTMYRYIAHQIEIENPGLLVSANLERNDTGLIDVSSPTILTDTLTAGEIVVQGEILPGGTWVIK